VTTIQIFKTSVYHPKKQYGILKLCIRDYVQYEQRFSKSMSRPRDMCSKDFHAIEARRGHLISPCYLVEQS
jgi:hypothetical protein